MLSKALVSGAYQKKLEELAALPDVELTALVPPSWREPRVGTMALERRYTSGYRLETLPLALNGRHHVHFYPTLGRVLRRERPDVFHIDEESFNLATFLALRAGRAVGARCCFYNWATIDRRYPPPFSYFEQYAFRHAQHAIAGNADAATIIERHGYRGPISVIPQFGVDPELFALREDRGQGIEDRGQGIGEKDSARSTQHAPFTVGYVGRLVPEKGVRDLVAAVGQLPAHVQLRLVGDGAQRSDIEQMVAQQQMQQRVAFQPAVGSTDVPSVLRELDVLVLPSRTMPNWKEQFGRVLTEAMSCGVPVIGSDSGEIPHVIGDAGLVFPEGDVEALRNAIERLATDGDLHTTLVRRGRGRVLQHYTQAAIARRYYDVYCAMRTQPT